MSSFLQLSDSVSQIRGVGPRYLKYLEKLKIKTIKDLLWYFPFRYEDFSQIKKINELKEGEKASLIGTITKINVRRTFRKRFFIIEAVIEDDTGKINAIWFNQIYLIKSLYVGITLSLSGKVQAKGKKLILSSPAYEILSKQKLEESFYQDLKHTGRLIPIYPETEGLSSRALRYFIKPLLELIPQIKETLPFFVIKKNGLMEIKEALRQIHFPASLALAKKAKERFVFESLLLSQLYLLKIKEKNSSLGAPRIKLDIPLLQSFVRSLDFPLTQAQKKSLWEIAKNLNQKPMNRLLEGDVGSGKTIVAVGASLLVFSSGYQIAVMAPTEILARQHFEKFKFFLKNFHSKIALLTSSEATIYDDGLEGKISKKALIKTINSPSPIIVIGTHALIQKNIQFNNLGLLVVDEQHRFGVEQRKKLLSKNLKKGEIPHLLSMTATPIPRTLALVFYGDLDISIIDEMPEGRKKVITKIITPKEKENVYRFIYEEIKKGRQAFFVCPRIEEPELNVSADNLIKLSEKINRLEIKAVKKEFKKLKEEVFPDLKIAMLHGKMKPKEKEEVIRKFQNRDFDLLVTTSMIEVGIDIPNATMMIIEGAEHFGLAQLHQFRGRVGRAKNQSYCFLFADSLAKASLSRLKSLTKYYDGFKLAEIDLSLRGPGEFMGTKQSGIPDLVMSSLVNKEFIEKVSQQAQEIIKEDSTLKKWPLLLESLKEFQNKAHHE